MATVIRVAAVDDDRMLLDGLRHWLADVADVTVVAAGSTVDELLDIGVHADVVLLDLRLRDGSSPVENVRRLSTTGAGVLVISTVPDRDQVIATTSAGASGYITKNNDLTALVGAIRDVAAGRTAHTPELAFAWVNDARRSRPQLSAQEHTILTAYASGMTLAAAARRAGVRPGTAKEYLDRVKEKYRAVGRPAATKLELAERAREDDLTS